MTWVLQLLRPRLGQRRRLPLRRRPPRRRRSRLPRPWAPRSATGSSPSRVTRVQRGVSSVGGQFGEEAQGTFTIVTLRVKNIGNESQTFDASNQKAYAGSTAYEADGGASLFANEGSRSFLEGINPGNSITIRVVFDAPKGKKLTKIELHDSAFSGGVEAAL
jgi:hypothetical protein